MDGVDGGGRMRRSLKERLGFKPMSCCCGPTWAFWPTTVSLRGEHEEQDDDVLDPSCLSPLGASSPATPGMNLATALAAERRLRASPEVDTNFNDHDSVNGNGTAGSETPLRVSLMRLLEETDGGGREVTAAEKKRGDVGNDWVCCVCMGREKGAAFIPCGHTFCRVCSRELWLNRGSCPLCNRSILEILDIF